MCVSIDMYMHTHTYVHACVLLHICECLFFVCVSIRLSFCPVYLFVFLSLCVYVLQTIAHVVTLLSYMFNCCSYWRDSMVSMTNGWVTFSSHSLSCMYVHTSLITLYIHVTHHVVCTHHSLHCMYTSLIILYVHITRYIVCTQTDNFTSAIVHCMLYCIAGKFGREQFGKFGESSTKTI